MLVMEERGRTEVEGEVMTVEAHELRSNEYDISKEDYTRKSPMIEGS